VAILQKIDSNVTGLRYAEEASIGVLPATPIWVPQEPNTYADFGGEITSVARNPINPDRQLKKGTTTDLDASGGYNTDLTQENMQDILQGFFFADLRVKNEITVFGADATTDEFDVLADAASAVVAVGGTGYVDNEVITLVGGTSTVVATFIVTGHTGGVVDTVALQTGGSYSIVPTNPVATTASGSGTGLTLTVTWNGGEAYVANDLLAVKGMGDSSNNGLFVAAGGGTPNTVPVSDNLTADESSQAGTISRVGFQFATGDVDVVVSGTLPTLTTSTKDFAQLGLTGAGEQIFIGGDLAAEQFANSVNNGFARVRSVATNVLTLDKTAETMIAETGTGLTIRIFFGRVLKNETGTTIKRRTYQLERTLGARDTDLPNDVQAEYLVGQVPSELTLNLATADKVNLDLSFIGTDNTQVTGATGVKAGTRPALVEADPFNTSSDVSRARMSTVVAGDANPAALVGFLQEVTLTINNNVSPNKAIATLGAFEVTSGNFQVGGSVTAYFDNVTGVQAVRNNADVTVDYHLVKANAGISFDIPLMSLGDGRLSVEQDAPITIPLSTDAATGAKVFSGLNHTLLMTFWDYLPTLADV
jgi:hypothetical protein